MIKKLRLALIATLLLAAPMEGCATFGPGGAAGHRVEDGAVSGVPMYPGARIFGVIREKGRVIYLSLVTGDTPAKVADFYDGKFGDSGGWSRAALMDGRHFWRGGPDPDPYGAFGAPTLDVRVSPIRVQSGAAPSGSTLIAIQNRARESRP